MDILIIGCGPAGLMTAVQCSKNENNNVTLIDKNEKSGKKLYITGKGRCNVTNVCNFEEFMKNVTTNNKFLYASLSAFSSQDTINFFENNRTPIKIERGNRAFPVSDKASDITKTFINILQKRKNVRFIYNFKVNCIKNIENKFWAYSEEKKLCSDAVVIATGGKSYPSTGSTGDGYKFARSFGHTIIEPKPSLVPYEIANYNKNLAGLTLKNIKASITCEGKTFSEFGELLFTHNGVSGPVILTLSSLVSRFDVKGAILSIDLKPSLTHEQLDERLLRDIHTFKAKSIKNYLKELLPSSLIDDFLVKSQLDGEKRVCDIDREMRLKIIDTLKNFNYTINKNCGFDSAVVTSGGVNTREINPKNLESKLQENLYFAGEIIDVDALTGGFNIQIALSTGYLVGNYLNNK